MTESLTELQDERIEEMPIYELGLYILRYIDEKEQSAGWSVANTLSDLAYRTQANGERSPRSTATQQILAEAIHWLLNRELLSRNRPPSLGLGHTAESIFITRVGRELLNDVETGLRLVTANRLLEDLHLELKNIDVRSHLMRGSYVDAVLTSLRTVEARVLKLMKTQGDGKIGVQLMNHAFGNNGPLTDLSQPQGRSDGVRSLFAGAFGVYRNDTAHTLNEEEYQDPTEIAEIILLADLLHRHLDRVEQRLSAQTTQTDN